MSHQGQFRKSGEPYIYHPLRVTHLAARHWMDFASVIAALLHDVVEDTPVTLDDVEKKYGSEVAHLVDGLTKVTSEVKSRDELKKRPIVKQFWSRLMISGCSASSSGTGWITC